jgi:hypothetical protein
MKTTTFTCEACGAPAGPSGVRCPACHKATCRSLLRSPGWVAVAKTRTGDLPGETMLDTIRREAGL